jgi:hypothetical protein
VAARQVWKGLKMLALPLPFLTSTLPRSLLLPRVAAAAGRWEKVKKGSKKKLQL